MEAAHGEAEAIVLGHVVDDPLYYISCQDKMVEGTLAALR